MEKRIESRDRFAERIETLSDLKKNQIHIFPITNKEFRMTKIMKNI